MHTARRLSAFVRTNALLANLCDRKKVRDNGTRIPIAADTNSYAKNLSIPPLKRRCEAVFSFIISFRT